MANVNGEESAAEVTCGEGQTAFACGFGLQNKVRGSVGSWLILAEWKNDMKNKRYDVSTIKTVKVDGKKIKADTWYAIKNGRFVAVK